MSIDEERKNQGSEPIAARANTQPRRRGPMGRGGMMPGEKAGDFKGSMLKLLAFMGKFKFALGAVFVFAIASTVFNIVGPKVLSTATTELFEGVTAKIAGTGGIRFDVVGAILLTTLALYGFSALCSFVQGWLMTMSRKKPAIFCDSVLLRRLMRCLWGILSAPAPVTCFHASPMTSIRWDRASTRA